MAGWTLSTSFFTGWAWSSRRADVRAQQDLDKALRDLARLATRLNTVEAARAAAVDQLSRVELETAHLRALVAEQAELIRRRAADDGAAVRLLREARETLAKAAGATQAIKASLKRADRRAA